MEGKEADQIHATLNQVVGQGHQGEIDGPMERGAAFTVLTIQIGAFQTKQSHRIEAI
jgi:hypothetical protein